ncbi:MAG: hypothetical protein ACYTF0_01300 [Planctomycetota bacterium]|jgi:hypothetical protein
MVLVLMVAVALPAADPVVVAINGEALTLRQLEDELLRREGVERLERLVIERLATVDWAALADDDEIVRIGGVGLTRGQVAAELLRDEGARVRQELISITLVRQALEEAGIVIDDAIVQAEFARQERAFERRMAEAGGGQIGFTDYLRMQEGTSAAAWMAQEGFRMGAGLHEMVMRATEVSDDDLRVHYEAHFDERFLVEAAVHLRVIDIPYRNLEDGSPDLIHRATLADVMATMHRNLVEGTIPSFAKAWRAWGKPYDPYVSDGDIGWIGRDGARAQLGSVPVPPSVVAAAFAAAGPRLLAPIPHERGICLAEVIAQRAEQRPALADIADAVRRDYIEEHLQDLTRAYMAARRGDAAIEYQSLSSLVIKRLQDLGLQGAPPPAVP